jgi:hypothetical protein
MGRIKSRGDQPTLKQAKQGLNALHAATALGFRPEPAAQIQRSASGG